jgi:hypothetical protein
MIAFTRVASFVPARSGEAIACAHEIARHMQGTYGIEFEVMLPVDGSPQRIAWSSRYADLATLDAVSARIVDDARYWELLRRASDHFLPGSMQDSVWRTA